MVAGVATMENGADTDAVLALASQPRVCVALFNEGRGRVFIVCAGMIEDAREFAVQIPAVTTGSDVTAPEQARLRRARIRECAAQTAKLVAEVYASSPFGCLLVGGMPGMTPDWVSQYLPGDSRAVPAGVLRLPVSVGESVIVAAVLGASGGRDIHIGNSTAMRMKMPSQRRAPDGMVGE